MHQWSRIIVVKSTERRKKGIEASSDSAGGEIQTRSLQEGKARKGGREREKDHPNRYLIRLLFQRPSPSPHEAM
jgi:hypothetical protein